MSLQIGLPALVVSAIVVSLLLSVDVATATTKAATVALKPNAGLSESSGTASTTGTVTVVNTTGPGGGTVASVTVDITVNEHTYVLYVVRGHRDLQIVGFVTWITGTGSAVTLEGVQVDKAPTNGQRFQLVDLTAGQTVAVSDPIRY